MEAPPQETQRLADSLDASVNSALAALSAAAEAPRRALVLRRLDAALADAALRLPAALLAPRLLRVGKQMQDLGFHAEAATAAYGRLASLRPHGAQRPATACGSLHDAQLHARLGLASCAAEAALAGDGRLTGPHVLRVLHRAVDDARAVLDAALVAAGRGVVLAAIELLASISGRLMSAGLCKEALPAAAAAAAAIEARAELSTEPGLLRWRGTLHTAAAHAAAGVLLSDEGDADGSRRLREEAAALLRRGAGQLDGLLAATTLDPVPQPALVLQQLQSSRACINLLAALIAHLPPAPPELLPAGGASGAQSEAGAAPTKAELLSALAPLSSKQQQLSVLLDLLLCGMAGGGATSLTLKRVKQLGALMPALDAAAELALGVLGDTVQRGQSRLPTPLLDEQLHLVLLRVAYAYSRRELLEEAASAAAAWSQGHSGDGTTSAANQLTTDPDAAHSAPAAAAAVLLALERLHDGGEARADAELALALRLHSSQLAVCLPDADAPHAQLVLEGLHAALSASDHRDGLLRGSVALRLALLLEQQQHHADAAAVLEQSLAAIECARNDVALHLHGASDEHLRWVSAERTQPTPEAAAALAGMTHEEQELACLHADALLVHYRLALAMGARTAALNGAARREALLEAFARRQRQANVYGAMTARERRDALAAAEAAAAAPFHPAEAERELLGACGHNAAERALALTCIARRHPSTTHQAQLLQEACELLLAAQQAEGDLLRAAQQSAPSNVLSNAVVGRLPPPRLCRRTADSMTLDCCVPLHNSAAAAQQPCSYAVFCKPVGAGIGLSINASATEHRGTGTRVPIGERVTVYGLRRNEAHVFALAVYDREGQLLGELGTSSPPVLAALPLPLHMIWGHVLLTAAQLGHVQVVQRASIALLPRFLRVMPGPRQPLWRAHPAERYSLCSEAVAAAAAPLLRLVVQCVYAVVAAKQQTRIIYGQGEVDALGSSSQGGIGTSAAGRDLLLRWRKSAVPAQVETLEACARLLLAAQVAATIGDELLLEEGALRVHALLAPLLARAARPGSFLHRPLAGLHAMLADVRATAPTSVEGAAAQQASAGLAAAASSFWLLTLAPASCSLRLDCALLRMLHPTPTATLDSAPEPQRPGLLPQQLEAASMKQGRGMKTKPAARVGADDDKRPSTGTALRDGAAPPPAPAVAAELTALLDAAMMQRRDEAAARLDGSDLAAKVLSMLRGPEALASAWPLLAPDHARNHPRWLSLCVLLLEAAAQQHGAALLLALPPDVVQHSRGVGLGLSPAMQSAAWAGPPPGPVLQAAAAAVAGLLTAVQDQVRHAPRVPQLSLWPTRPRWSVNAALADAEVPAADGQTTSSQSPSVDAHCDARRLAAALLLQRRLPVLLQRRRRIHLVRSQLAAWAPWRARLHTLLSGLAAEAAAMLLRQEAARNVSDSAAPGRTAGERPASAAETASSDARGTPRTRAPSPGPSGSEQAVASDGALRPPADNKAAAAQLTTQALAQAARAATIAARAGPHAWQQLLCSTTQLWNTSRQLLTAQPSLLQPPNLLVWALGTLPVPAAPPLAATAPEARRLSAATEQAVLVRKAGSGKAAIGNDKRAGTNDGPPRSVPAPASKASGRPSAAPALDMGMSARLVPLPELRAPHAHAALRAVAEAVLTMLLAMRAGDVEFQPLVIVDPPEPVLWPAGGTPGTTPAAAASHSGPRSAGARCQSARSQSAATAAMSLGSDAPTSCWHSGGPVDVTALTRLVALLLQGLLQAGRFHGALSVGRRWLDACDGSADAALLPLVLAAAEGAGATSDAAQLASASTTLERDSSAVLGALQRVRAQLKERVTPVPRLLSHLRRSMHGASRQAGLCAPGTIKPASMSGADEVSVTSACAPLRCLKAAGFTAAPTSTGRAPSQTGMAALAAGALAAEYGRVIRQLRDRGERAHMVLALNELGDVHEHNGDVCAAVEAWSGALDELLGVYGVLDTWHVKLERGNWSGYLWRFGMHGLLQAGVLLGKLARLAPAHNSDWRLRCARLAAELLPAVFAADAAHPQRAAGFAATGVPPQLLPGVDLFDDPFRCNVQDLCSALDIVCRVLLEAGDALPLLPLTALWEHLSLHVLPSADAVMLARVTRIRALISLGLLAPAADALAQLLLGEGLPGVLLPGLQPPAAPEPAGTGAAKAPPPCYDASQWPGRAINAAAVDYLCDAELLPSVADAAGPWLCGQVALTHAAWLAAAGSSINCWCCGSQPLHGSGGSSSSGGSGSSGSVAASAEGSNAGRQPGAAAGADSAEARLLEAAVRRCRGVAKASRAALGLPPLPGLDWDAALEGALLPAEPGGSGPAVPKSRPGALAAAKGKAGKGKPRVAVAGRGAAGQQPAGAGSPVAPPATAPIDAAAASAVAAAQTLRLLQHRQLLVMSLEQLARVEQLQWRPRAALQTLLAACDVAAAAATDAGDAVGALSAASSTEHGSAAMDDADRAMLTPCAWLGLRCQVAGVLLQLGQYVACEAVASAALQDAERVRAGAPWTAALLQARGNAAAARGDHASGLNSLRQGIATLQAGEWAGGALAWLQLDTAALCNTAGARAEADALAADALATSTADAEAAGLQEMLEGRQQRSISLPTAAACAAALTAVATGALHRRQLASAEQDARKALTLLSCACRCLPLEFAQAALLLARVLRLEALLQLPPTDAVVSGALPTSECGVGSPPQSAAALQLARLDEAASLLRVALHALVIDAAGCHPLLLRGVLLEAGGVEVARLQLARAADSTDAAGACGALAAALAAAATSARHARTLFSSGHALQPAVDPSGKLPGWLLDWLRGQEEAYAAELARGMAAAEAAAAGGDRAHATGASGAVPAGTAGTAVPPSPQRSVAPLPVDSANMPDAVLGRAAVCFLAQRLDAASGSAAGLHVRRQAAAQALVAHAALRLVCPALVSKCCWAEPPALTGAPPPPPGTVLLQWRVAECVLCAPASWGAQGRLPPDGGAVDAPALAALPQPPWHAACLYLVCPPQPQAAAPPQQQPAAATAPQQQSGAPQPAGAQLMGELAVPLDALHGMRLRLARLRRGLAAGPLQPGDVLAAPRPSDEELAAAKQALEALLRSGMGGAGAAAASAAAPPPLPPPPPTVPAAFEPAAAPAPAPASKTPSAAVLAPGAKQAAAVAAGGAAAAAGAAAATVAAAQPLPLELDWRAAATWERLEAALDSSSGLAGCEPGLARWLGGVLG